MKLKCEFVVTEVGDEVIAVPVGAEAKDYRLVLKLNEESGKIVELLNHEITLQELITSLKEEYTIEEKDISSISDFIAQLRESNLIEGN